MDAYPVYVLLNLATQGGGLGWVDRFFSTSWQCSRQAAYQNAASLGKSLELLETHPDLEAVRISEDRQQEFAVTASAKAFQARLDKTLLAMHLTLASG